MFVNVTNHPHSEWSPQQLKAAEEFGEIADIPFPQTSPSASEKEICKIAQTLSREILSKQPSAVLCQGEFTLTYALVSMLKADNIKVLAACSDRCVTETTDENGNTRKLTVYKFVKFREYR